MAHNNLGNLLAARGEYNDAAENFQIAMQLDPDCAATYQNLGNLRLTQGLFDKAANNYIRAIQLYPNDPIVSASLL